MQEVQMEATAGSTAGRMRAAADNVLSNAQAMAAHRNRCTAVMSCALCWLAAVSKGNL